jgi:hypothetical protein
MYHRRRYVRDSLFRVRAQTSDCHCHLIVNDLDDASAKTSLRSAFKFVADFDDAIKGYLKARNRNSIPFEKLVAMARCSIAGIS